MEIHNSAMSKPQQRPEKTTVQPRHFSGDRCPVFFDLNQSGRNQWNRHRHVGRFMNRKVPARDAAKLYLDRHAAGSRDRIRTCGRTRKKTDSTDFQCFFTPPPAFFSVPRTQSSLFFLTRPDAVQAENRHRQPVIPSRSAAIRCRRNGCTAPPSENVCFPVQTC